MTPLYGLGLLVLLLVTPAALPAEDVLQHHLHGTRDGWYVDPHLTPAAATTMHRDPTFHAPLPGPTYAQPLYVTHGPGGRAAFIVATEQNMVVALDARDGAPLWVRHLGMPVPRAQLPCGNLDPLGITGTPAIDPEARIMYVAATTTPDGVTTQQRLFAPALEDGTTRPGWPLEVAGLRAQGQVFTATVQQQRSALLLHASRLYVPYGGHFGDCGGYHGWVVAVPVDQPTGATAWATAARGGGIWAPGGVATDGSWLFAATGNTFGARTWGGGEAVIRLGPGATFSGEPRDYFAPSNWPPLDAADLDVGGSGPVVLEVPGATPSHVVVALGKNGVAYVLNRQNLGGIGTGDGTTGEGVQSRHVASGPIITAAAAYTVASGTYVVFTATGTGLGCPGTPGNLVALKLGATAPPTITVAWCADTHGRGAPIVTTTDGAADPIVWSVGAESSNRLYAFHGETGAVLFAGGGPADQMHLVRRFQTPIAVHGRIVVAADQELYVFTTP
jgi:hypothetical protein